MNKRYYKKKGASYKERLRCPLCGHIREIGYFSQDHRFAIYRYTFAGRGKISCAEVVKPSDFMTALIKDMVGRLLDLIQRFTGVRYVPERYAYPQIFPPITPKIVPKIHAKIIPPKVWVE